VSSRRRLVGLEVKTILLSFLLLLPVAAQAEEFDKSYCNAWAILAHEAAADRDNGVTKWQLRTDASRQHQNNQMWRELHLTAIDLAFQAYKMSPDAVAEYAYQWCEKVRRGE